MFFKSLEALKVAEDYFILHGGVQYYKTPREGREIHATFIVLILTEQDLYFLTVVKTFKQENGHVDSDWFTHRAC